MYWMGHKKKTPKIKNSLTFPKIAFDCQYFHKKKLIIFRTYLESFKSKL